MADALIASVPPKPDAEATSTGSAPAVVQGLRDAVSDGGGGDAPSPLPPAGDVIKHPDQAADADQAKAGAAADGTDGKSLPLPAIETKLTTPAPHLRAAQLAYQAPTPQPDLPQLAVDIARYMEAGNSRFQIRLDPPELGRIEVRLDFDASGGATTRMTVEKTETLDLLQRDQKGLERALQQAGIDPAKTSLEFSLRQNTSGGNEGQRHPQSGTHAPASSELLRGDDTDNLVLAPRRSAAGALDLTV